MNFWDNFEKDKHLIIAHRGARSIRAENTMSAFVQSLGKCDMVEFDVGFSRDGVAVIIHDDTLERTSDVRDHKEFKAPYNVVDYDYAQLLKLDFGSWFVKEDPFGTIKKDEGLKSELDKLDIQRILTLDELLAFLKKNKMIANIEIKDAKETRFDEIAAKEVLKIVEKHNMKDMVCISSFNHEYLKQIHDLAPDIEIAALQEDHHPANLVEYLKGLHVKSYNPDFDITDETLVKKLNNAGFFVNVYTVNKRSDIEKLFNWGVKSVFTDFPQEN
ncbi:MAG: glycerophosphodiester phosphodiesterase family protein [Sulfurospirillaceae bacterium]|nr:glycerophosphodiester phosphodiesterase family protein [Sulfurospirillaceae bacterium]